MIRFSAYHPAVLAFYFVSILGITMFSSHPLLHAAALVGGLALVFRAEKKPRFGFVLLLFFGVALTNPLFSHRGETVLLFLNDAAITLESLLCGVGLGGMLAAALLWFRCFNGVMTADKLLFLLGRLSPKISLLLSSALRFVPLLKERAESLKRTRRAMGAETGLKGTVKMYSALITWALEHAIDTGAAMKARGYGLPARSQYALFRFTAADGGFLLLTAGLDGVILSALAAGKLDFSYYPTVSVGEAGLWQAGAFAAFWVLCLMPAVIEIKEVLQWNYYRSKI